MKCLGSQTGTDESTFTNKRQEIISGIEVKIEEMDTVVKENIGFEKLKAQNIQKIWDTIERPNLRIIRKEVEFQLKVTENSFQQNHRRKFS